MERIRQKLHFTVIFAVSVVTVISCAKFPQSAAIPPDSVVATAIPTVPAPVPNFEDNAQPSPQPASALTVYKGVSGN